MEFRHGRGEFREDDVRRVSDLTTNERFPIFRLVTLTIALQLGLLRILSKQSRKRAKLICGGKSWGWRACTQCDIHDFPRKALFQRQQALSLSRTARSEANFSRRTSFGAHKASPSEQSPWVWARKAAIKKLHKSPQPNNNNDFLVWFGKISNQVLLFLGAHPTARNEGTSHKRLKFFYYSRATLHGVVFLVKELSVEIAKKKRQTKGSSERRDWVIKAENFLSPNNGKCVGKTCSWNNDNFRKTKNYSNSHSCSLTIKGSFYFTPQKRKKFYFSAGAS